MFLHQWQLAGALALPAAGMAAELQAVSLSPQQARTLGVCFEPIKSAAWIEVAGPMCAWCRACSWQQAMRWQCSPVPSSTRPAVRWPRRLSNRRKPNCRPAFRAWERLRMAACCCRSFPRSRCGISMIEHKARAGMACHTESEVTR